MYTRRKIVSGLLLIATFLLLVFTVASATASSSKMTLETTSNSDIKWATYHDPRFDFSIEYPASWNVRFREDRPGFVGGTVTISEPEAREQLPCEIATKIEIGLYLVEREPSHALADWSEQYDENYDLFAPDEILVQKTEGHTWKGREVFQKEAISPLTEYTYLNVPQGRVVWFLWMNSIDEEHKSILEQMGRSMKFGKNAPTRLQDAYGDQNFSRSLLLEFEGRKHSLWRNGGFLVSIANDYRTPVSASASILYGSANSSKCDGTHSGSAAKAIDINVGIGNTVKNSATSYSNSAGWNNSGYGYLVTMYDSQNNYIAYYAHLHWIDYSTLYSYWPVPQGYRIGISGDSGAGGAHLHFHVRTTGWSAVDLAGMPGLSLYNEYPHCAKATCAEIEALPDEQCTCGRVN